MWVSFFIFSKIPELVDTVFLVLQKKPVIFLHWFHHVTVLLYCWHAYTVADVALLLWLLPLLTMLAPGDRPEMTSDQQPEEASESVASDASVSSRMRDAAAAWRTGDRFEAL